MRILFILLISPFALWAQSSWSDDFSDSNFTQNPAWIGDTAFFQISAQKQLQLSDSVAGTRYLSTASNISQQAVWEFSLSLDFNPSGSNFAEVYLMADRPDLNGGLNGYFVRVGGSSADKISLFKQSGNSNSLLVGSPDDWVDSDPVQLRVRVTRNADQFELEADTGSVNNYISLGFAFDSTHWQSQFFGVRCEFTKTRAQLFYFDDFQVSGQAYTDTIAPEVLNAEVLDSLTLKVSFSEPLDTASALDTTNYADLGGRRPAQLSFDSASTSTIILEWQIPIPINQPQMLIVQQVADRFGNAQTQKVPYLRYRAEPGHLIFTELLPDPTPVVGIPPNSLPEEEYIEIYNSSPFNIPLKDWKLIVGEREYGFPKESIDPQSYLVLGSEEAVKLLPDSIRKIDIGLSRVALRNSGQTLQLISPGDVIVEELSYSESWYGSEAKGDGGWALERIDLSNLCNNFSNWTASENAIGGTPGYRNSVFRVNPDTSAPTVNRLGILGDTALELSFSENIYNFQASDISLEPFLGWDSVYFASRQLIRLFFSEKLEASVLYEITIAPNAEDCAGNKLLPASFTFGLPERAQKGELLINEVLFNPRPGGSDFVEIYNHSNKLFDLSKLVFAIRNPSGDIENNTLLSENSRLLYPGEFVAISEDIDHLRENYLLENPDALLESDLPPLADDEATLVLLNSNLSPVDELSYQDDWHSPLLTTDEGVSLERLSFTAPTNESQNWYSAAETAGFATPGYQNSQVQNIDPGDEISLEPEVFSPNQDGYHDILNILYQFDQPGTQLSLSIWSSAGYPIKEITHHTVVGSDGFYRWDGTDENGQLSGRGIYILVAEIFNPAGETKTIRKTFVLSL